MRISLSVMAAGVLAAAAGASAAYTSVNPPPGSELSHAQILQNIYGGSFALNESPVPTYSNGAITAERHLDSGDNSLLTLLSPTGGDDQAWSAAGAGPTVITAKAKYAGDSHVFGWIDDSVRGGGFQPLLPTNVFNAPVSVLLSSSFRWALSDTSTGKLWTSRISDNHDDAGATHDQMVTYRITGPGITEPTYLLMWEDRIGGGSDYDYNDAAIEISARSIPGPGAASLGALGAVGLLRRKRR